MNDIDRIETVRCHKTDYENLYAYCPSCGKENIYNRATDIATFEPISRERVQCVYCRYSFPIGNDMLGEKYEYMILDCHVLLKLKKYMYCIINLCQACEAFFMKGITIKLLFQPWRAGIFGQEDGIYSENRTELGCYDVFNQYSGQIQKAVRNYAYNKLRNVCFDLYLIDKAFSARTDIDEYLKVIDCYARIEPSDADIESKSTNENRDLFIKLRNLGIGEMRNKVVHKEAYRPTKDEAEKCLEEVHTVVIGLKATLNFDDYYFPGRVKTEE